MSVILSGAAFFSGAKDLLLAHFIPNQDGAQ